MPTEERRRLSPSRLASTPIRRPRSALAAHARFVIGRRVGRHVHATHLGDRAELRRPADPGLVESGMYETGPPLSHWTREIFVRAA
jgi:hypothetical protein